jgi:tetratricopeptide (TPR) repeat protein
MVFDDVLYLRNNPLFRDISNFWKILTDFSGTVHSTAKLGLDGDIAANFVLRPVTYLTFWFNYVTGGLNPWGYRLVNITIHVVNAFLVFDLARQLRDSLPAPASSGRLRLLFPALGSGLFLIHPLQIESVTYLIQRATSLNAMFYLATLCCHQRAWVSAEGAPRWRAASVGCCLLGMLSKESGVTAPAAAVLLDWMVRGTPLRTALLRAWPLLATLPAVPALVAAVAIEQRGGFSWANLFNVAHGENTSDYGARYLLTRPIVWWHYVRLFLWPVGLNADPDFPLVKSVSEFRFWGPLLLPSGIASAALWSRRYWTKVWNVMAPLIPAMGWFAVALLPSSVLPLPDAMAEHRVYLALAGLCIGGAAAVVLALEQMPQTGSWTRWGLWSIAVCGCLLGIQTQRRNQVWSSEEKFWGDVCRHNPRKLRPWLNYGSALAEVGAFGRAEEAYERAIQVQPCGLSYANLAVLQARTGQPQKALSTSLRALDCPASGYDFFVLGVIGECHFRLQNWAACIPYLQASLRVSPGYFLSLKLLGVAHLALQNPRAAREVFETGLSHHPENPELLAGIREAERQLQNPLTAPPPSSVPPPQSTSLPSPAVPSPAPFKLQLGLGR